MIDETRGEPGLAQGVPEAPDLHVADPGPELVLSTQGLSRCFGNVRAVDQLDLHVQKGQIYGFLGVNGAGKTTTIRMLMGIIRPDEGTIELLGERSRRTTIRQKQAIGYVSQEQTFYAWMTCRQLGRFVGGFYPSWDAAEFERLLTVLELPPERKASQLSGGMKVKLALALALAPRPALLILDEPTSGLDPVARREFLEIIQRQSRDHGRTTFFSSHIIGEVERVADCVGVIHHGRMRYEGDLQRLRLSVRQLKFRDGDTRTPDSTSQNLVQLPQNTTVLPFPVTGSFEILRDESREGVRTLILQASPEFWQSVGQSAAEVTPLTLEDIFIALVGTAVNAI